MKKLGLISALSLGLLVLAGCTLGNKPQEWSSDVMAVYNESKEMTCTLTYTSESEEWTSIIYVKDWMMKQDTTATVDWEEYTIYTLARDGKMYMWWDMYGETAWFSMTYDIDIKEELGSFEDMEEGTTVSCVKWVKKNSVFDLPKDIEFQSMDDLYSDIELNVEWDEMDNNELVEEAIEEVVEQEPVEEIVEEVSEEEPVADEMNEDIAE